MFEDDDLDTLRDGLIISNSMVEEDDEDGARDVGSSNILRCPRCRRTRGYRPVGVHAGIKVQRCLSCGAELAQCRSCSQLTILSPARKNTARMCQHCGTHLAS